mmetsp:Transcript_17811/g.48832  ORF Transcript_17811/g.48832 Transcript_17811/m.48832 type:complete len:121 (-) Transcript_17811:51-413(-)
MAGLPPQPFSPSPGSSPGLGAQAPDDHWLPPFQVVPPAGGMPLLTGAPNEPNCGAGRAWLPTAPAQLADEPKVAAAPPDPNSLGDAAANGDGAGCCHIVPSTTAHRGAPSCAWRRGARRC